VACVTSQNQGSTPFVGILRHNNISTISEQVNEWLEKWRYLTCVHSLTEGGIVATMVWCSAYCDVSNGKYISIAILLYVSFYCIQFRHS
jgi:hypothetical protein